MKRDVLKAIKSDMREVLGNKKCLKAEIKTRLKEIEEQRKEALSDYMNLPENDLCRQYMFRSLNESFDRRRVDAINGLFERYHNDQNYYLIYEDGSFICITAEEILDGKKLPKMSGIVYAHMQSADDDMDTEIGDRDFYTDERMAACDYDYSAEDERLFQYELAIEIKYGTEYGVHYIAKHPDYQQIAI